VAVEPNGASLRIVEAQEQLGDRGLPRTAGADERKHLAGTDLEGHFRKRLALVARVAKAHRVELHVAPSEAQGERAFLFRHRRLLVEKLHDPLGPGRRLVERVEHVA
jgi:hypothetical protein